MKEAKVEDFLREEVARRGGFTVKLSPQGYAGIPDRLVVLPGAVVFIEVKRPKNGRVAKLQLWWRDRLRALGAEAHVCKNAAKVSQVLDAAVAGR